MAEAMESPHHVKLMTRSFRYSGGVVGSRSGRSQSSNIAMAAKKAFKLENPLDETPERTWRERLKVLKEILRKDKLSEQFNSLNAKYAAESDMKVVENSLLKDIAQKKLETQRRQINYFMKLVIALVPGLLFLWLIRESVMLLHTTSQRFLYRMYNQLFNMAYKENLIMVLKKHGSKKGFRVYE